ncbi:MAG TPA: glycosyltransferase family 4 protein [bacterium]|nr:glycosyltransferase family 4 protein [bacterium]HOL47077.1 glycosyltransferase family 4 protein [bacterium]HPQ18977.1 glycosyltransferase family 4 protein [bacterium]
MKKKVLHIHTLPVISGSGLNTYLSMKLINKEKYEVALACKGNGKLQDLVINSGFRFISLKYMDNPVNPVKDILALIELIKLLKKEKFDIVHTHNSKAGFIGRLAAWLVGVPKIVHTVHGFAFHNKEKFIWRIIFLFLEKIGVNFCDEMIFISQPLIDWAKKYKIYKPEHTYKIYSGIELEKFQNCNKYKNEIYKKYNISEKNFIIGEVAKLWEGKGHITILKATKILINKIPELKILFVGEGYLKEKIENFINENNLKEYVILTGFTENVEQYYSVFNISLLISSFEGMGRVILESFAAKVPVIATNVGGIVDLIMNEYNGLLIEPDDVNGLVNAILKLYYSKELREKFICHSYSLLTEKFSAQKMAEEIEKVYEK